MHYRDYDVPRRGVTAVRGARHSAVDPIRTQGRQAGDGRGGCLRRLCQCAVLADVLLTVSVVMLVRLFSRGPYGGGIRNVSVLGDGLKMNAGGRDASLGDEVTHRALGADSMRVQQTEEEQAKSQHTPQSR